jgi:hypothetical protein
MKCHICYKEIKGALYFYKKIKDKLTYRCERCYLENNHEEKE